MTTADAAGGCFLCEKPREHDDERNLIVARAARVYAVLNLFPYNTGHVMIVPYTHVSTLTTLPPEALAEITALLPWMTALLERILRPAGFNVGLNIGEVAGAGIAAHLHMHVVPRWGGDTNFMTTIGATKVLPEMLADTAAKVRPLFRRLG